MSAKPVARIVVPSLVDYPREVIKARLPDYNCEVVEDDYFVRPALISMRGEEGNEGQGTRVAAALDELHRERESSLKEGASNSC